MWLVLRHAVMRELQTSAVQVVDGQHRILWPEFRAFKSLYHRRPARDYLDMQTLLAALGCTLPVAGQRLELRESRRIIRICRTGPCKAATQTSDCQYRPPYLHTISPWQGLVFCPVQEIDE